LYQIIQQVLVGQSIDCIIQPAAGRRKKLLLADMESTIIEQEMLDELADTIGLRDKVAAITARAMNGELDFAAALKERAGLLKGLPVSVLDQVAKRMTIMPGAAELLAAMKQSGASAWLVTGGFACFAKPVADRLGFDRVFANELILCDGYITGEVAEPIVDKNTKKNLLSQASAELGLSLGETAAVGDGANDIPMLAACVEGGGLGVAYRAKPNVRAAIPHQINHSDLRALMYAQGYKDELLSP
jgi:phosphoserine phosphatase